MPTASRLIGLSWYSILGFFVASLMIPYLKEGVAYGQFAIVCTFYGAVVGWTFAGPKAGDTMKAAIAFGLTSVFLLCLYSMFSLAFKEMLRLSTKLRYDGPMEALVGCVELMIEYSIYLLHWDVLTVLILGGIFGGWIVEITGRKWS